MGCSSSSSVFQFGISICELGKTENPKKHQIRQVYREVFTMQEKINVINYMLQSTHDSFKSLFKTRGAIQECIFYFSFDNNKGYVAEYEDAVAYIPKDEYSFYRQGNSSIILNNLFVISGKTFSEKGISRKGFFKQIEGMVDIRDKFIMSEYEGKEEVTIKKEKKEEKEEKKEKEKINRFESVEEIKEDVINEEMDDLLTDYYSDSDNTLDDKDDNVNNNDNENESESDSIENKRINFSKEITESQIDDLSKIISQEQDYIQNNDYQKKKYTKGLASISIKHMNFSLPQSNILKTIQLITTTKLIPNQTTLNHHAPLNLKEFHFIENKVEGNQTSVLYKKLEDFLNSKRTYKAEYTSNTDLEIRKFKTLRVLDLSLNLIPDNEMVDLIKSFRNIRLHILNLSGNSFGERSLLYLSQWILKNKSVKELYLNNNCQLYVNTNDINANTNINILLTSISYSHIEYINLSNINLAKKGEFIKEIFQSNPKSNPYSSLLSKVNPHINSRERTAFKSLKVLKLNDCYLNKTDLYNIIECLSYSSIVIEEIDLSNNNQVGDYDAAKLFLSLIVSSRSLSSLYIENNKINDYDLLIESLCNKRFSNNQLSFISISDESINYFSLFTCLIGNIERIGKIKKDIEILVSNGRGVNEMTHEEKVLYEKYGEYKKCLNVNV